MSLHESLSQNGGLSSFRKGEIIRATSRGTCENLVRCRRRGFQQTPERCSNVTCFLCPFQVGWAPSGSGGGWRWSTAVPLAQIPLPDCLERPRAAAGQPVSPRPHAEARRVFASMFRGYQMWLGGCMPRPAGGTHGSAGKTVVSNSAEACKKGFFPYFKSAHAH